MPSHPSRSTGSNSLAREDAFLASGLVSFCKEVLKLLILHLQESALQGFCNEVAHPTWPGNLVHPPYQIIGKRYVESDHVSPMKIPWMNPDATSKKPA
jgi:hypothetical protein